MNSTPYRRFALVATQRSGSTLLVKSLDSEPRIFCAGEIFHGGQHTHHPECNYPQTIFGSRFIARVADRYFQAARVRNHVEQIYIRHSAAVRAVGFKVMTSQLRKYHTLLPSLAAMDTVLFYLYRQDSFAAALSNFRAKLSGVYHSDRKIAHRSTTPVTANLDDFHAEFRRSVRHKEEVLGFHAAHGGVLLAYEDLVSQWDAVMTAIGEALGVPQLRVDKLLDRLGDSAESVQITNLDALRERFGSSVHS